MKKKIPTFLIILVIIGIMNVLTITSCSPVDNQSYKGPEKETAEVLMKYNLKYSDHGTWVEKIRIDNHDYLVFGSGVANPPTVIHSEDCPCKK